MRRVDRAIKILKGCRDIHVDWAEHIESGGVKPGEQADVIETVGDADWHRRWVDDYNYVINVLRGSR